MTDLSTTYLGLKLKNPLVASASPLTKKIDSAQRLEQAGIGGIVMYSLFEEQIIHESLELDHYLTRGTNSFAEAQTYLPDLGTYNMGPDKYLDHLSALKKAVSVPVISSLNGVSKGGWVKYARHMQDAGADALELNMYYLSADPDLTGKELEETYVELVSEVKSAIGIPLAVKLSPSITSLPNFARKLAEAGADGLVLFNRFYQPDIDLDQLEIVPTLELSSSKDLLLPLRWISILYGKVGVDFALTSGVHNAADVLKAMMAGAKAAMLASVILQSGYECIPAILKDLEAWMQERDYKSITQMQGSMSQKSVNEPAAIERANYIRILNSFRDLP
jgi:dihydroorotate dehydrogenase (fumarate)